MPNSTSLMSYADVKEILEKAITSPKGLKITFDDQQKAVRWLSRANTYRTLDRKNNTALYPETHTLHKASAFDVLNISREGNVIVMKVRVNDHLKVEEL